MPVETRPFDPAEYLDTPEGVEAYLQDAFSCGDPAEIVDALGVVARAMGMTQLSEQTGLSRPALYRALIRGGNPGFATVMKVARALGFNLAPVPISQGT